MKAFELAMQCEAAFEVDQRPMDKEISAELRRLAEVNAELLMALESVCKEFDVFKFPLDNNDMSQAAFVSIRALDAIAKAKDQQ